MNKYSIIYASNTETLNTLFHAVFEISKNSFSCQFAREYSFDKSCIIKYGISDVSNQSCNIQSETRNSSNNTLTNTVTVLIPTLPPTDSEYCFVAIGMTENFTIAVEGTFMINIVNEGNVQ